MPNKVQSVERALDLLCAVAAASGQPVGVRELARRTGLKAPTAHDLLRTLLSREFLDFDPEARAYRIGPATLVLAEAADPARAMTSFARPWLERLHGELHETVTAMIFDRGQVVVIDGIQAGQALAVVPALGPVRVSPHRMATGQVVLAYQSRSLQEHYVQSLSFADAGAGMPRSEEELFGLLDRVRRRGWAEAVNVLNSGIGAVSVPVLGPSGRLALGIGCSAPLSRFNTSARRAAREIMQRVAREMESRLLGASAAPDPEGKS